MAREPVAFCLSFCHRQECSTENVTYVRKTDLSNNLSCDRFLCHHPLITPAQGPPMCLGLVFLNEVSVHMIRLEIGKQLVQTFFPCLPSKPNHQKITKSRGRKSYGHFFFSTVANTHQPSLADKNLAYLLQTNSPISVKNIFF